jgi:hypothetical protein
MCLYSAAWEEQTRLHLVQLKERCRWMVLMCRWRVPFVARAFGGSHKVQACELDCVGGGDIGVLRVSSGVQKRKGEGETVEESGVRGVPDEGSRVRKEAPGVLTAK